MMCLAKRLLPALVATTFFPGIAVSAVPNDGPIVARTAAESVGREQVREWLDALPMETRAAALADDANFEQALRGELVRRAMLATAKAQELEKDAGVVAALDRLRDELLLRALMERESKIPVDSPKEEEIRAAYDAGIAAAAKIREFHLAQIFVALPDGADPKKVMNGLAKVSSVQGRIARTDFAQLAREISEHADSAGKGGDLGFIEESRLLPEVRKALVDAEVGAMVGPVKTSQGVHFFKLLEVRPVALPGYPELRARIAEALRQQQTALLARAYVEKASREAGVSVNQIALSQLRTELARKP